MSGSPAREIGLVGLGLMGSAIAKPLLQAGFVVHGSDPVPAAQEEHRARGGVLHATPAAVAGACDTVLLSLPNGAVVRQVCFGEDGIVSGAMKGLLVVDTSTTHPSEAESVGRDLLAEGISFIDLGLSGTSSMLAQRDVLALAGGESDALDRVRDVLETFCRQVMHVGGNGDGMRAKLLVNHVLTINRFALAEALVLAESMDMNSGRVLEVLKESFAHSRAMDIWGPRMVESRYDEPTSRIKQHDKDARLILGLAEAHGAPTPVLEVIHSLVLSALEEGLAEYDNSAIIEPLRRSRRPA